MFCPDVFKRHCDGVKGGRSPAKRTLDAATMPRTLRGRPNEALLPHSACRTNAKIADCPNLE